MSIANALLVYESLYSLVTKSELRRRSNMSWEQTLTSKHHLKNRSRSSTHQCMWFLQLYTCFCFLKNRCYFHHGARFLDIFCYNYRVRFANMIPIVLQYLETQMPKENTIHKKVVLVSCENFRKIYKKRKWYNSRSKRETEHKKFKVV